jgi:hypothetical protein
MKGVLRGVFVAALVALSASADCKYCGHKTTSENNLTASLCQRHPNGPGKGRHALYEGGEKES